MSRSLASIGLVLAVLLTPTMAVGQEQDPEAPLPAEAPADDEGIPPLEWKKRGIIIKAGATYSDLRGKLAVEDLGPVGFSGDFGYSIGVSLELPISESLSIQPELLATRKFAKINLSDAGGRLETKLSVNYFELPILLKWYPGGRNGPRTHFVIGPTPAVKFDSGREVRIGDMVEDVAAGEGVKNLDWGVMLGIGFEFHEVFSALTLDVRYNYGFVDINKADDGNAARWNALYLLLGVKF